MNRVIRKTVPERAGLSATHTRDVFYGYDVGNRQTYARFDSTSGEGVSNGYDTLGRLQSSTLTMDGVARTLSHIRDVGSRRTQLSYPDGLATNFTYDAAGRMQMIHEGPLGSFNALWTYGYTDLGRRVRKTMRHGQYAEGQADNLGRLTSLTADLSGTAHDNVTSFTHNPASQVGSRTISNNAWAWTAHVNVDRPYAVNGLNQYTSAGPASFAYDANGNLTGDGSRTYLYDVENRLVSASGATTAQLRYDPLGRLYETSGGAAGVTRFLYDGDELVAEYNSSGTLLRRYVHGASVDDPLIWYEGSGYGDPRWLMADHQGSIVGISQASTTLGLNAYDEYGIPGTSNQGRFQFTGQAWIPELGMYHYKARIYSPTLGRFLQTDPIGYDDQVNLYAYVGNDPVNANDPTGTCSTASDSRVCAALYEKADEWAKSFNQLSGSDKTRVVEGAVAKYGEDRTAAAVSFADARLTNPVDGDLRGDDSHGSGGFGASRGGRSHQGIDIAAEPWSSVRAAAAGVFDKVGQLYRDPRLSRFTYVQITHTRDIRTRYMYTSPLFGLKVGSSVGGGQIIGVSQRLPYPGIT